MYNFTTPFDALQFTQKKLVAGKQIKKPFAKHYTHEAILLFNPVDFVLTFSHLPAQYYMYTYSIYCIRTYMEQ